MTAQRRIAFATSTRADYGPARWVLADLRERSDVDLTIVATGTHLDPAHGHTVDEIRADGHRAIITVPVRIGSDDAGDRAAWLADWLVGATVALEETRPDLLILLGDRFETLIAAQAATLVGIPLAHLHGGEKTSGAIDDSIRHAITKLSHVHLAASAEYARRIRQMGERHVHTVGSPGLCALEREPHLTDGELAELVGRTITRPYVVVTYHPVTAVGPARSMAGVTALIDALSQRPDLDVIVTGVNVDPGFAAIADALRTFAKDAGPRVQVVDSLGNRGYLSLLRGAAACVGNSSSGIVEAPALGVPTVNIGPRQDGRLRAASVIDVPEDPHAILAALARAEDPAFIDQAQRQEPPYGRPGASRRIADLLATMDLSGLLAKDFVDCPAPGCALDSTPEPDTTSNTAMNTATNGPV